MKDILPIRDDAAYTAALAEVRRLWGTEPGTAAGDRLDVLMVLVDDYENKHHAIEPPDPIDAILLRMETMDLTRNDIARLLGISSGRLSEILNRRRRLTIEAIRTLAPALKLSERCLLQSYDLVPPGSASRARRPGLARTKARIAA